MANRAARELRGSTNETPVIKTYVTPDGISIGTDTPKRFFHILQGGTVFDPAEGMAVFQNNDTDSAGAAIIIIGGDATGNSQIVFGDKNDANIGRFIYFHATDSFQWRTNNAIQMNLDSAGKLGLGVTIPITNFHVQESNTDTVPMVEIEQLSTGDAALQFSIVGQSWALGIDNSDTADGFLLSRATSAGTAVLGTNPRLRIASTGAVDFTGTGTQLFEVRSTDEGAVHIRFRTDSTNRKIVAYDTAFNAESSIQFLDDSLEFEGAAAALRATINSTGLVLEDAFYLSEMSAPSAPAANDVVIWAEDDGGGKTRLMARFNTGANQQIVIQP